MYIPDKSTTYPPGLYISRCTDFKMVSDRTCPRLPICDEGQKKGFKLYFNKGIPSRGQKKQLVNHSHNWKTLFQDKNLIKELDVDDVKTLWNKIVWYNPKGARSSNSEHVPTLNQCNSIQILHPTKVYHFDDANVCFVNNPKDDILKHLKKYPIIFFHQVFNIRKTSIKKLKASVQHLNGLQQDDKAKYEATWKIWLEQETNRKADVKVRCKVVAKIKAGAEAEKTRPRKLVSKPIVVNAEAPKVAESTPILVAKKPKDMVDGAPIEPTSNKASSKDTTVVVVHTNTFGPTPI